jgi:hypothetical protein
MRNFYTRLLLAVVALSPVAVFAQTTEATELNSGRRKATIIWFRFTTSQA